VIAIAGDEKEMTIVINCITIIYLIFAIVVADDFSQYYIV